MDTEQTETKPANESLKFSDSLKIRVNLLDGTNYSSETDFSNLHDLDEDDGVVSAREL